MTVTDKYDSVLRKWGKARGLPFHFLKALAIKESDMDPMSGANKPERSAKGLLQVTGVVLDDYNRRHRTKYTSKDLLNDVNVNVMIATETLQRILVAYSKHPCLKPDWKNKRWITLFTFGWNAGYSEKAGVGFVVGKLEKQGVPCNDISIDLISDKAASFGASEHLSNKDKVSWCKGVAHLFWKFTWLDEIETGNSIPGLVSKKTRTLGKGFALVSGAFTVLGIIKLITYLDSRK